MFALKICKHCGNEFRQYNSLQKCPCQTKRGIVIGKATAPKNKSFKQLKNEFDVREKKLSVLEAEAKAEFQKWIRWRDREQPCISSGRTETLRWEGGHCFPAGQYSGVMFDEMNVHKQSYEDNQQKHGNRAGYCMGIQLRYGDAYWRQLVDKANATRYYKWSREELVEIKAKYRKLNLANAKL